MERLFYEPGATMTEAIDIKQFRRPRHRGSSISEAVCLLLLQEPSAYLPQQQMAERFYMTPRTFARRLDQEGISYRDLLKQLRMKIASQYLAEGQTTIAQISLRVGYRSPSNFIRAFKRHTRITPAQYRRLHSSAFKCENLSHGNLNGDQATG